LMPYGIRVDCATSGQQAIDMVRAESPRYDAVFMDHMMPGMDGIEAVRIIREEIDTDYARKVPIIALTANAIAGNDKMFLESGFQSFISKPIDLIRLDSILRQWVRDKEREKERGIEGENPVSEGHTLHTEHVTPHQLDMIIESVDMAAGLKRFGNNEEAYIKVLQSYAVHIRTILGELEKHIASMNLSDYAIAVHGIKGASYGIGALLAGSDAERLEQLAKAGNTEQVMAESGAFVENMKKLLDSIDNALNKYNSKKRKPSMVAPDPSLLRELREACGKYDANMVDKVMSQLESFEYESGAELIAWLRNQVEEMNYEVISGDDWPLE